ncbi:MFS transporter [Sphaerisporangium sp. TRM90804]|uniref:MFS transporter n=1 Tax=Sphaerisporangium sp. TRM90804 TaxID=3031113 RepID=UPI002446B1FE|nr:MFS transporter [Sphaerisporangium sp. TRM90804]MDH2430394.1 MFS transporter [Sphaerisporangium sp. TRM90804]
MLGPALIRRFPVLGIRDFRLLLADRLLAPAAVAFSIVGVSFAVLDLTGSTADLSYVLAAQIAPSLVFTLLSGVVADRIPPQRVIVAANVLIAVSEGGLGLLVLTGEVELWHMIVLETLTGVGMAVFWPASQALLPKIVPDGLLQEANAISRLAMNGAQMGGAAVAGVVVAVIGPGWALSICGVGLLGTIPMLLSIRVTGHARVPGASMLGDLREGWSEFVSHTWLWAIVLQFCVTLMAWYGGFQVLGPVVAKSDLGGPAAWGVITAAEALGLLLGGLLSLRFAPRRPILFVACIGAVMAISPLSLAMRWPLLGICGAAVLLGVAMEIMMVQWSVALARNIPSEKLARVSAYDALGSVMAMPVGALVAGPLAHNIGTSATQYGAAAVIVAAAALTLLSRQVRTMRAHVPRPDSDDDESGLPGITASPI